MPGKRRQGLERLRQLYLTGWPHQLYSRSELEDEEDRRTVVK